MKVCPFANGMGAKLKESFCKQSKTDRSMKQIQQTTKDKTDFGLINLQQCCWIPCTRIWSSVDEGNNLVPPLRKAENYRRRDAFE